MFKCQKHKTCVHLGDVCDDNRDCPGGDDETFCSLKNAICPSECKCLTTVFKCDQVSLSHIVEEVSYQSPCRFIYFSKIIKITNYWEQFGAIFPDTVLLTLIESEVVYLCQVVRQMHHLRFLDVTSNLIAEVPNKCFQMACRTQKLHSRRII